MRVSGSTWGIKFHISYEHIVFFTRHIYLFIHSFIVGQKFLSCSLPPSSAMYLSFFLSFFLCFFFVCFFLFCLVGYCYFICQYKNLNIVYCLFIYSLFSSSLFMSLLFLICLKTTVAGFEPTPPEEKWFQVTRLRPLGHTVFVFILSFLFMYFYISSHKILFGFISLWHFSTSIKNWIHHMYVLECFPSWIESICCLFLFVFHLFNYYLFNYYLFFPSLPFFSLKVSFNMFLIYSINVMLP